MQWLAQHWLETFGALTGLLYVYLEIKENIWLWPIGIISSAVYVIVYYTARFYADMGLMFYYLIVSIYGWILWAKGNEKQEEKEVIITKTPKNIYLILIISTTILWAIMAFILDKFTNSPVPFGDALTTALGITGTWMLAKKYIEQWIVWIFADSISVALYLYKGLYPTVILYTVFTVMAFLGYSNWRKIMYTYNEQ